jgi:hypothetical protein
VRRWALAAILATACDPLVGGECADGFATVEGACVAVPSGAGGMTPDGGMGGGGQGGGAGGFVTPLVPGLGCGEGEVACIDGCKELASDPNNCGACGHRCATELCSEGACVGADAGHVVVIGMGYVESTAPARRLLGNAVFLSDAEPLRIVDDREGADPASVEAVLATIAGEADKRGREHSVATAVGSDAMTASLATEADVLLVHDRRRGARSHGPRPAQAINTFARSGGVVVILTTGDDADLLALLGESGLLDLSGYAAVEGTTLLNVAPTDALGIGVASPFLVKPGTTALVVADEDVSVVLASEAHRPVVVHRALMP